MNKLIILFLIVTSCSSVRPIENLEEKDLINLVGKKITIEGKSKNAKMGALISIADSVTIWIDDLEMWPDDYYLGEENCKTVRVTGELIAKDDLPVFIHKEGEPWKQGIPVPEGTDLKAASRRYLLKDAEWKVISD